MRRHRHSGRLSCHRRRLRRKDSNIAAIQTSTNSDSTDALALLPLDDGENNVLQDSQSGQDCESIEENAGLRDQLSSDPSIGCTLSLKPNLSCMTVAQIDIPPEPPTSRELSIAKQPTVSIPPRSVYHPAVLNACNAMFGKHPSNLTPQEINKFKLYQRLKISIGDSIEEDIVNQTFGGVGTCVLCGHLT